MAPESLAALKFSAASDMWSFGVLLWEVVLRGETPYGRATGAEEVMKLLLRGQRLPVPASCSVVLRG
jgi:serine/threonine protein kinase